MSRAQVSIEFAMVFIVVLIFVTAAIGLGPQIISDASGAQHDAQVVLDTLKLQAIMASTAREHYEALVPVPAKIAEKTIEIEILPQPDNIALIRSGSTILAKIDLPVVASVTTGSGTSGFISVQSGASGVIFST